MPCLPFTILRTGSRMNFTFSTVAELSLVHRERVGSCVIASVREEQRNWPEASHTAGATVGGDKVGGLWTPAPAAERWPYKHKLTVSFEEEEVVAACLRRDKAPV